MNVVEIFNSIEGEGVRVGAPCTFIRLFGCNLHCDYCDSQYACVPQDMEINTMSINEIVEVVKYFNCPNVTVTGGEPLIHDGIEQLLNRLIVEGFFVNVETNGTIVPTVRNRGQGKGSIFYTVDFKTFSSGMHSKMNPEVFKSLREYDVLKFVVGSEADLDQALSVCEKYNFSREFNIFVSPVFGKIQPVELVEYLKKHQLWDWRVQVQLHKIIWDPKMKGV